jgi:cyclomaltodextrinase
MMRKAHGIAGLALALLIAGVAAGGPVPGIETFDRKPVTFPVSPSTEVWDIGKDEYLVTFKWKPGAAAEKPVVVGTFNGWNRSDLPMQDADGDGVYTVTARLKAGDYRYKFGAGDNGWFTDEGNPLREEDGHQGFNSILRLGIMAEIAGKTGKRGDGEVVKAAATHEPADYHYLDLHGDEATIRVRTLANDLGSVQFLVEGAPALEMKRVAYDAQFDYWECVIGAPSLAAGKLEYRIALRDDDKAETIGPYKVDLSAQARISSPDWAKHAIWYQIVIDRFRDGDPKNNPEFTKGTGRPETTFPWRSDFYTVPGGAKPPMDEFFKHDGDGNKWPDIWERLYGGDFQGVIDKLDYLKSLGVNAIYFNPVFEATSGHKYNGKSYQFADDGYGVPGEFAKSLQANDVFDAKTWKNNRSDDLFFVLLREAKKRKMRVIIDGVFNHLGDNSYYFLDVKERGKQSPYADWWDVTGWDPFTYRGWAGSDGLPQFRKNQEHGIASDSARKYILDCTSKWMDPNGDGDPGDGIDGWRLDVPMDVPMAFWHEWCAHVRKINPEAYIVGEVWNPADEWLDGQTFDAVMNYQFRAACLSFFSEKQKRIKASEFDNELARLRIRYPQAYTYVMQNLLDSHDTDRIASRLYNPDIDRDRLFDGANRVQNPGSVYKFTKPTADVYKRLKLLAVFQATYVGAPMIYYGTEVGMYGADDPQCRNPMWWKDMMPYDLPEDRIDQSLFRHYQALFRLRSRNPVLSEGGYQTVLAADEQQVFAFIRGGDSDGPSFLVVLNNSDSMQDVKVPTKARRVKRVFGEAKFQKPKGGDSLSVTLPPVSGSVFRLEN